MSEENTPDQGRPVTPGTGTSGMPAKTHRAELRGPLGRRRRAGLVLLVAFSLTLTTAMTFQRPALTSAWDTVSQQFQPTPQPRVANTSAVTRRLSPSNDDRLVGVTRARPDLSASYADRQRLVAARAQAVAQKRAALLRSQITIKLASYNVLGSSHTTRNGDKPWMGPGSQRARWAAEVVRIYGAEIVGLQEIEFDQLAVMQAELPQFAFYPGTSLGEPAVRTNLMWNRSRFELTGTGHFTVRFVGLKRVNSYVRLRDRATQRQFWVVNVHNSPNRGKAGTFAAERDAQLTAEVKLVNQLRKSGPVILIGDMNDHEHTYCRITGETDLRAAQGGSTAPCRLPPWHAVDWIFGSRAIWSDVHRDKGPLVGRSTDHHIFLATATLK